LTAVLLLTPVPLSNVAPAAVISLISLAYVEEDGLLLSVALLAAIVLVGIESAAVWGTIVGAVLISGGGVEIKTSRGPFGGSLCTSSGHSCSISSRISSDTSERPSVSSRNLCSRSKSSATIMWSEIIRGV